MDIRLLFRTNPVRLIVLIRTYTDAAPLRASVASHYARAATEFLHAGRRYSDEVLLRVFSQAIIYKLKCEISVGRMIMSDVCGYPDLRELGEAGRRIYRQRYQTDFEKLHFGKVVAINPSSEQAFIGQSLEEVIALGRSVDPTSLLYVLRVGGAGVLRVRW